MGPGTATSPSRGAQPPQSASFDFAQDGLEQRGFGGWLTAGPTAFAATRLVVLSPCTIAIRGGFNTRFDGWGQAEGPAKQNLLS